MRKTFCLVLCVLFIVCISGCNTAKGPYAILPMEQVHGKVDTEMIDRFLTDNDDYDFYGELKINYPTILSELVNVTPKALKDKCSIYRFLFGKGGGGLAGEAFLVYDGAVYPLGTGFGGWGVTEFAYINQDGQDQLYFIYSWGSGMHHTHIGAFDFNSKELTDTGSLYYEFGDIDIAFCLSEDGQTLGICEAEIDWSDRGAEYLLEVDIEKGEYVCDISEFEFKVIDNAK